MSCTRLVSMVLALVLLGGIAVPSLAMGPTVVPDGVEAGPNVVPDGVEAESNVAAARTAAWWVNAWVWLRGLLDRMGPTVILNG